MSPITLALTCLLALLLLATPAVRITRADDSDDDISADAQSSSSASGVISLTDANFDALVFASEDGADWFVEFLAPWCGHCKSLIPIWQSLAESEAVTSARSPPINIGTLDATVSFGQAKRFDIRGFPTLIYISGGKMYRYSGARTLEALEAYVEKRGITEGVEPQSIPPPPADWEIYLEWFLSVSGETQSTLMRKPLASIAIALVGMLVGMLTSFIIYATCMEKLSSEYVQWTDPATGKLVTVPYRRTATPANQSTAASTTAATPAKQASKKKQ